MRGSYFYLRSTSLVLYSVRFGVLIVFLFMSPLQPYTRVYWDVYATLTTSIKMAKQDMEIKKKTVRIIRVVLRNSCQWSNIFSRFITLNDTEKVIDWVRHLFLSSVKLPLIYQPLITFTIAILSEKNSRTFRCKIIINNPTFHRGLWPYIRNGLSILHN